MSINTVKKPMTLVNIALILLILNAVGNIFYGYSVGVEINTSSLFPRMALIMFLLAMVHLEKNWARLLVGVLAAVASIGLLASLILHFYTNKEGLPSLIEIIGFVIYAAASYLLLGPKSVRNYFKKIKDMNLVT